MLACANLTFCANFPEAGNHPAARNEAVKSALFIGLPREGKILIFIVLFLPSHRRNSDITVRTDPIENRDMSSVVVNSSK